jgi:hypothetical protein
MIRLRSLLDGTVVMVPATCAVEVLDQEHNVALLLLPDAAKNSLKIVTAAEEPNVAKNYSDTFAVRFSRVVVPDLTALSKEPPQPQAFGT